MRLMHRSSLHLYQVKLNKLCYLLSQQQQDELLSSLLPSSCDYFHLILTYNAFFGIFDMILCFCILMLDVLSLCNRNNFFSLRVFLCSCIPFTFLHSLLLWLFTLQYTQGFLSLCFACNSCSCL